MKYLYIIFFFILISASLRAQTTLLAEDFSGSMGPGGIPTGWSVIHHPQDTGSRSWRHLGFADTMYHDSLGMADNTLLTLPLDCSGVTSVFLHLDAEIDGATFLANHPFGQGNGLSSVRVTTDGGSTFGTHWIEQSEDDGFYRLHVDLSTYAGQTNVQVGFNYFGTTAHKWTLENVVVDDQDSSQVDLEIGFLWTGPRSFLNAKGATIGGLVRVAFSSTGNAPMMTQFGLVNLSPPIALLTGAVVDNQGTAKLYFTPPGFASGLTLYTQAVDWTTGTLSNPLSFVLP